jgi:hypothetical protein
MIDLVIAVTFFVVGFRTQNHLMFLGGFVLIGVLINKEISESNIKSIYLSYLSFSLGVSDFFETGQVKDI